MAQPREDQFRDHLGDVLTTLERLHGTADDIGEVIESLRLAVHGVDGGEPNNGQLRILMALLAQPQVQQAPVARRGSA